MAKLTPLAKGLFTIAILGGTAAAAWHLGLKDLIQGRGDTPAGPTGPGAQTPTPGNSTPGTASTPPREAPRNDRRGGGALGSDDNPLKVSIVSFHGYAPALVANGQSLKTQPGSLFDREGLNVEFVIQDDLPTISTVFEAGTAQCIWRTSDFWAQEHPNLRNSGHDAKAVMIVDNTRGADAIITNNPAIRTVEDLAGRKVAMLQFTPSHGMTIDAIDNSSLSARKKGTVQYVYINAEDGLAGVRAALESGSVDAAVLWDPDLSLAINATKSRVIYSTKTASNLIFDVIVCDHRVLEDSIGRAAVQMLVNAWMKGVDAAKADPDGAVDALV